MALPGAAGGVRACAAAAAATGRWRGGDGAVRRIRFREPMTVSHPVRPPPGARRTAWPAAQPGALGANRVERADGTVTELAGCDSAELRPGDTLEIETPGGGGYGAAGSG